MECIKIDKNICSGCQECAQICPVGAISGEKGEPATIDESKCIHCGQCVQKCKSYLSFDRENADKYFDTLKERKLPDSLREPLFAAHNVCHINEVKEALANPSKICVVSCAPAVRVAIAEEFGVDAGCEDSGRLAAALYELGFDHVYDTNFAADFTIMEEGTELINRITKGTGVLPMFTSCCPGWVSFMENNYPEMKEHLSTCKSPQQMQGALEKTYGAKLLHTDSACIYTVSVMPCTAKQFESARDEMWDSGHRDVDVVLTTRELAYLIKDKNIDYLKLEPKAFEESLGAYTGAGAIFGITGGVMEAAIRTGYEVITQKPIEKLEVTEVRGTEGVRLATVKITDNLSLKVAVVTGLKNVYDVVEKVKNKELDLDFIEVMACPQGCISGGGQPKLLEDTQREETFGLRRSAIYGHDEKLPIRKSHENESVKKLYEEFLKEPNSEEAHHLLHTEYCIKGR